jgi:hypothetical protein
MCDAGAEVFHGWFEGTGTASGVAAVQYSWDDGVIQGWGSYPK